MKALNFCSGYYHSILVVRSKCSTIRVGDKRDKYHAGDVLAITYGRRFHPRRRVFTAVVDDVVYKPLGELTNEELASENPDLVEVQDAMAFLCSLYGEKITLDTLVSLIYFSEMIDA